MPKKRVSKEEKIREAQRLAKEGLSANEIQRVLRKRYGSAIRRTVLLKVVREAKGVPKKPEAHKYTPKRFKYVIRPALYGTVEGKGRRWELYSSSGKTLYQAMKLAVQYAPKDTRHARMSAEAFLAKVPWILGAKWDKRPRIESWRPK